MPSTRTRIRSRLIQVAPLVLAVALLGLALSEVAAGRWPESTPAAVGWATATAAPVAWVRSRPVVAWLAFGVLATVLVVVGEPQSGALFFETAALLVGVGAGVRPWRELGLLALSMVVLSAVICFGDPTRTTTGAALAELGPTAGLFAVLLGLGRVVGWRNRAARGARADAVDARAESEATTAQAVADERARIARDLHDVVAHSVSLMVVQAVGGRGMLSRDRPRAVAAFDAIDAAGAQALDELARMVGVLAEPAAGGERPGLAALGRLVAGVGGAAVTLEVTGSVELLPPGVDVAAYRIVQEALTNAVKHADGAVTVHVVVDRAAVEVEVRNPLAAPEVVVAGGGYGLLGMRERAALYGGTVEAGPADDGRGWRVHARLPLEVAA